MQRYIVFAVMCVCAFICGFNSKELTRSKATHILKESVFSPQAIESGAERVTVKKLFKSSLEYADVPTMDLMKKVGWMSFSSRKCGMGNMGLCIDAAITDKGQERSRAWDKATDEGWKIPTRVWEFGEVTGIEQALPTIALVHYTWHWIPTEDGKILGFKPSALEQGQWNFTLFDDGWRANPKQ
jgi:hypothetical protein